MKILLISTLALIVSCSTGNKVKEDTPYSPYGIIKILEIAEKEENIFLVEFQYLIDEYDSQNFRYSCSYHQLLDTKEFGFSQMMGDACEILGAEGVSSFVWRPKLELENLKIVRVYGPDGEIDNGYPKTRIVPRPFYLRVKIFKTPNDENCWAYSEKYKQKYWKCSYAPVAASKVGITLSIE